MTLPEAKTRHEQENTADVLKQARELLEAGRIEASAAMMRKLLHANPDNDEALYILAVCQRYLKEFDGALETLDRLKALRPAYGKAWQEEGHLQLATGNNTAALTAFRRAVSLNSSLIASWGALVELARQLDKPELLTIATDQHARLAALPRELLSVRVMMAEGRNVSAERLCRAYLKENPQHVEGMRLLANLGIKAEVLDDAEFILESAVAFEPDNRFARFDYMNALYRRQKYAESLEQARILRDCEPENSQYRVAFANQCVAVGDFDQALEIYDDVASKVTNQPALHLVRGHALKTIGRLDDAIESYRNCYRARPDFGDAYWSLANLKTYRFTEEEMQSMQAAESAAGTRLEDRIHLCFALGKSYEDGGNIKDSMDYYERGNALRKDQLRYDAERMSYRLSLQRKFCSAELFAAKKSAGTESKEPIFIVGLPRAGSTLLEQILASHSQVDGTHELPYISSLAFKLDGRRYVDDKPRYPQLLREIPDEQLKKFGDEFLADAKIHRGDAPYFIDKMPNNFRHIGLIQLILPNAAIIDARRHPMACCFSSYKQLFATGQEFTYGLAEIGAYYKDYVELMDHWDRVLPGKVLRVQYEDVVADLETQVRRILDHCGLPFEEACLNFHRTERSVRTPSSEQVRQPIYKSGLEQWRKFESYLDPLKQALGPVLQRYPIDD
ncbi:MAG: tetratricopeptide repeat protein [Woeseiaceae bacterium]|nr:tetratricopeptide repeat protein [Woeseiaceae bacterium]